VFPCRGSFAGGPLEGATVGVSGGVLLRGPGPLGPAGVLWSGSPGRGRFGPLDGVIWGISWRGSSGGGPLEGSLRWVALLGSSEGVQWRVYPGDVRSRSPWEFPVEVVPLTGFTVGALNVSMERVHRRCPLNGSHLWDILDGCPGGVSSAWIHIRDPWRGSLGEGPLLGFLCRVSWLWSWKGPVGGLLRSWSPREPVVAVRLRGKLEAVVWKGFPCPWLFPPDGVA
jgi:hypothetical protein